MFCPNCGKACSNVRFCPSCGTQLPRVKVHTRTAAPQSTQATAQVQSTTPQASVPHAPAAGTKTSREEQVVMQQMAPFFSAWAHLSTEGRASRSEYWFGLLSLGIFFVIGIVVLDFFSLEQGNLSLKSASVIFFALYLIMEYCWAVWTVRRFHDFGKSACIPVAVALGHLGCIVANLLVGFHHIVHAIWIISFGTLCVLIACLWPSVPKKTEYGDVPWPMR